MGPKMTDAERAKKYRMKNQGKVRKANKMRMRETRKAMKKEREENKKLTDDYRRKERERKQKYRARKKEEAKRAVNTSEKPTFRISYKSPQALGKAIKKVTSSLPKSPSKQTVIVAKLAKNVGLSIQIPQKPREKSHKQTIIEEFFLRPDLVYTCPGLKDEVTVWRDGKKEKLRKYYLVMSLREAFALLMETHHEMQIGFSSFCKMRPENVLLLHQTPADQCKCITCENFFLKLSPLNLEYNSDGFWNGVLCNDTINSDCWRGQCTVCGDGQKLTISADLLRREVTWKQWEKGETGRLSCSVKTGCTGELLSSLQENLTKIAKHLNVKRIQANEFSKDKENPDVRVLQIDFAMNYSCEYQSEVQSTLWSRGSVTLFTAAALHNGKCDTYLICSDTKEKEKNTVATFLTHLYEKELEMKCVEEVIWSDGPSSEFKNRFMVHLLRKLSKRFNKTFTWKYSATSHGKGIIDGIGGRAKSLVRTAVMSRSQDAPVVQNAFDFATLVRKLMPSTTIILLNENAIQREEMVWKEAVQIPGIKSFHVVKCKPNSDLEFFYNSLSPAIIEKTPAATQVIPPLMIGSWVLVQYDNETYPGEIITMHENCVEYEVTVMVKAAGTTWKWPVPEDKLWYHRHQILKMLSPPEVFGSRGQFIFKEL